MVPLLTSDQAHTTYTDFPSFAHQTRRSLSKESLHIGTDLDLEVDLFGANADMAGHGSPSTFIKEEPDDFQFNPNRSMEQNGYDMSSHYGGHSFANGEMGSVNPSDLTMSGSFMNNFGSSFHNMGNSAIEDDELLALVNLDDQNAQQPSFMHNQRNGYADQSNMSANHNFFQQSANGAPLSMSHPNAHVNQMYSHTPDGAPIASPFVQDNYYNQLRSLQGHSQGLPANMRTPSSMPNGFDANMRNHMQRQPSDSRSPLTPRTPALGGLHLGTPDSGSYPQPIVTNQQVHRHQKSVSSQWEDTPGSAHSWMDSPLSSPHVGSMHHPQISEVLTSGKHASLPTKVENAGRNPSVPAFQSQEAKRRRRRESHNLVERRRRDNINERIHDLSRLVPSHRLDDEKIRKQIQNNGPLSPTLTASGMSPPQATSLLAGGTGRRAAGSITQGFPPESDKDKGPNKGDILNGAVGWTRDLMWMLYLKLQQEDELRELVHELGGAWPFERTEEEKRMRTELMDSVEKNDARSFQYTRGPGSGLRVPKHTTRTGEPLDSQISPQNLSPGIQSGGSGTTSGGQSNPNFWTNQHSGSSGRGSFSLKEEDEYGMEMG